MAKDKHRKISHKFAVHTKQQQNKIGFGRGTYTRSVRATVEHSHNFASALWIVVLCAIVPYGRVSVLCGMFAGMQWLPSSRDPPNTQTTAKFITSANVNVTVATSRKHRSPIAQAQRQMDQCKREKIQATQQTKRYWNRNAKMKLKFCTNGKNIKRQQVVGRRIYTRDIHLFVQQ